MRFLVSVVVLVLITFACSGPKRTNQNYFDSLIFAQKNYFKSKKYSVIKTANVKHHTDTVSFNSDSTLLGNELQIFQQLSSFSKPAFRKSYKISNVKDNNSNLSVREYKSSENIPVPSFKFYYFKDFKNIKQIEATFSEKNPLFSTVRKMKLEFQVVHDSSLLKSFSIEGFQKLLLSDTVKFHINSTIRIQSLY